MAKFWGSFHRAYTFYGPFIHPIYGEHLDNIVKMPIPSYFYRLASLHLLCSGIRRRRWTRWVTMSSGLDGSVVMSVGYWRERRLTRVLRLMMTDSLCRPYTLYILCQQYKEREPWINQAIVKWSSQFFLKSFQFFFFFLNKRGRLHTKQPFADRNGCAF